MASTVNSLSPYAFAGLKNVHAVEFNGMPPIFGCNCFSGVAAKVTYPRMLSIFWRCYGRADFGGCLTWCAK